MRSGVWLWLAAGLAFSACSGEYPLEPTACDRYCHATQGLQCDFYSPAGCVSQCESDHKGDEACRVQLDAVVACFESEPEAITTRCSVSAYFGGSNDSAPCDNELQALYDCSLLVRPLTSFGPR